MKANVEEMAIEKLKTYHQEELLDLLTFFTEEEKQNFYEQVISLDFEKIDNLYNELNTKELVAGEGIEEISAINKDKLDEETIKKYDEFGRAAIENGEYALVTMSGGQGTRLGYDKPKGTYPLDIFPHTKSLFEILADKLKETNQMYHVVIPWYIMTSKENNNIIKDFFKEHYYFDYPKENIYFFEQNNLPLLSEDKKLIIEKNKKIKEAADGNGGIFLAMDQKNIIKDMDQRGVKWAFISSIDNVLLKIADTTLIGLAIDKKVEIATKSILKNSPNERVGAICKKNGKIKVVEYSEMSEQMKNARKEDGELRYGESHVMCNLFSVNALKKLSKQPLPYHIAHKKADYLDKNGVVVHPENPNVFKFETFIFDSWMYFDDIAVLRGKREEDFAPIKNKEGEDSPQTAIELYNNYIQRRSKK